MYLPRNWAFDRMSVSINWRSETKVLGFRKRYFFGKSRNTSKVFILSEDGAKRLLQNYRLAFTSSASTSIDTASYEEYWENRKVFRAAEHWRLYKHPLSLTPWKSTTNISTPQFRFRKTPIKWSLTQRSILNKPDDLPNTFCIVISRREIRGGKMQRASGKSHWGVRKLCKGSGM